MEMYELWLRFHWSFFPLCVELTINQLRLRYWLRRKSIIWTNDGLVCWRLYASLGLIEIIIDVYICFVTGKITKQKHLSIQMRNELFKCGMQFVAEYTNIQTIYSHCIGKRYIRGNNNFFFNINLAINNWFFFNLDLSSVLCKYDRNYIIGLRNTPDISQICFCAFSCFQFHGMIPSTIAVQEAFWEHKFPPCLVWGAWNSLVRREAVYTGVKQSQLFPVSCLIYPEYFTKLHLPSVMFVTNRYPCAI